MLIRVIFEIAVFFSRKLPNLAHFNNYYAFPLETETNARKIADVTSTQKHKNPIFHIISLPGMKDRETSTVDKRGVAS